MELFIIKIIVFIQKFWFRLNEAVYITKNQYKFRLLDCYQASNNQVVALIQIATKRIRAKFSIRYLATTPKILQDIHPLDVCKITFIANLENEVDFDDIPEYLKNFFPHFSIIKQSPTLKISSQSFNSSDKQTLFTISNLNSQHEVTLSALELAQNPTLLYSIGSHEAARVGISASNDFLRMSEVNNEKKLLLPLNQPRVSYRYYHILCICYVTLILTGISIVRRMFPFYVPFTDFVVPFGGGILFFPMTFCIQDITTETYGFNAARQMVIFSICAILFYVLYSQIVINLPTSTGPVYKDNPAFSAVFNTQPRQLVALLVSLFAGSIVNDFFISKSKVILAGQYLWARILGSTMVGEAVLQLIGGVIGFSDKLDFKTQLLPNMILAYGYKILWCVATIPLIYMITRFLKKNEGVDVFDYDINYKPFKNIFFTK